AAPEAAPAPAVEAAADAEKALYAPVTGKVVERSEIPDDTFASGVLGDGVGILPTVGEVVAPFDGEISSTTDTKHAIGITGPGEMEVLIHVGVDTVNMKGDGFELFVSEGDKVKKGQKLMTFDIEKIKKAGYSSCVAVLLTNSDDYPEFKVVKTGDAEKGTKLYTA
ncbi:MAG: PTS glucose transporter subunit IIA, partial [Eubacteriales bacterium]|nr:PTS glucose transporter subunit IIA [Eubacteriales bacterium]